MTQLLEGFTGEDEMDLGEGRAECVSSDVMTSVVQHQEQGTADGEAFYH